MTQPRTVSVVPMTAGHVDALMRYEDEMFGSEAWSADAYRDEIADTRSRGYFAAVDDAGELLAWAGVRVIGDSAEVLTVGVIPAARRRGIARRMLRTLLGEATWAVVGVACAARRNSIDQGDVRCAGRRYARGFRRIIECRIKIDEPAAAAGAAGIRRLAEE